MEVSMVRQALILLYSLIIGVVLGAVYDTIRIQRIMLGVRYGHKSVKMLRQVKLPLIGTGKKLPSRAVVKIKAVMRLLRNIIISIQDILFFIFAGLVVTVFVYHANYGQIRWFALLGLALGFFVYYNTVGRVVMLCSEFIVFFIRAIMSYTWYLVYMPAKFVASTAAKGLLSISAVACFAFNGCVRYIRILLWSRNSICNALDDAKNGFLGDINI